MEEKQARLNNWVEGLCAVYSDMWEARARLGEKYLTRPGLRGYLVRYEEARERVVKIGAVCKETVYIENTQSHQWYYVYDETAWFNEKER